MTTPLSYCTHLLNFERYQNRQTNNLRITLQTQIDTLSRRLEHLETLLRSSNRPTPADNPHLENLKPLLKLHFQKADSHVAAIEAPKPKHHPPPASQPQPPENPPFQPPAA